MKRLKVGDEKIHEARPFFFTSNQNLKTELVGKCAKGQEKWKSDSPHNRVTKFTQKTKTKMNERNN